MSDLNINNRESKCERCQTEDVAIICHTCQPFHNFCHRCDSIIHSMKLKTNHVREPNFNSASFNFFSFSSKFFLVSANFF